MNNMVQPMPADIGRESGYNLDRSPVRAGLTNGDNHIHAYGHILESHIYLTCVTLDSGRRRRPEH